MYLIGFVFCSGHCGVCSAVSNGITHEEGSVFGTWSVLAWESAGTGLSFIACSMISSVVWNLCIVAQGVISCTFLTLPYLTCGVGACTKADTQRWGHSMGPMRNPDRPQGR